jgi:hypothetical protein
MFQLLTVFAVYWRTKLEGENRGGFSARTVERRPVPELLRKARQTIGDGPAVRSASPLPAKSKGGSALKIILITLIAPRL